MESAESRWKCATCGYDLRGSRSGDCPECGTKRRKTSNPTPRDHLGGTYRAATTFSEVRAATIATLFVWGGCTLLPWIGSVAWVLLALAGLWRALALRRLWGSSTLETLLATPEVQTLRSSAWVEVGLGAVGSALTFHTSMGGAGIAEIIALLAGRLAWVSVVGVNTFLIARVGLRVTRSHQGEEPPPLWSLCLMGTLVAPVLMFGSLAAAMVSAFSAGQIDEWIVTTLQLVSLIGCAAGIVGITACAWALSAAGRAMARTHLEDEAPSPAKIRRPRSGEPPVARPPAISPPGVIPFADEDEGA
ncbi:MAG: hypothetical protein EXS03_01940 [Phycisphaerales bacterium]|nr:hypothetical protein [Phycisphaerales bacterium]